jgi:hypothetical protein
MDFLRSRQGLSRKSELIPLADLPGIEGVSMIYRFMPQRNKWNMFEEKEIQRRLHLNRMDFKVEFLI